MHCIFFIYIFNLVFLMHKTCVLVLITVKKTLSNHVVHAYVVYFIHSIELWDISTSIFHVYTEFINKKVSDICLIFQDSIIINSHTFSWIFSILQFFLDEANNSDWRSLDSVRNIQIPIIFVHTTVRMELKPCIEVTL